jgi:hypothetical protein
VGRSHAGSRGSESWLEGHRAVDQIAGFSGGAFGAVPRGCVAEGTWLVLER